MMLHVYEPGQFIEELVFRMKPEDVGEYVRLEQEIMAKCLSALPGFAGWQIWESETNPGEVTSMYFWKSYESYRTIDRAWLFGKKDELTAAFGAGRMEFVKAVHETDKRYRLMSIDG